MRSLLAMFCIVGALLGPTPWTSLLCEDSACCCGEESSCCVGGDTCAPAGAGSAANGAFIVSDASCACGHNAPAAVPSGPLQPIVCLTSESLESPRAVSHTEATIERLPRGLNPTPDVPPPRFA